MVPVPKGPKWIAPPLHMAKFNVDAALAKSTNKCAVAAVARNAKGEYLNSSTEGAHGNKEETWAEPER